jgi:hypothetical protein
LAGEVVDPTVINAAEFLDVAGSLQAQQIAAMGAAIDERIDCTGVVTDHDDCGLADGGGDVIARFREFHRQAQVVPGRAFEQAFLLAVILVLVSIDQERNFGNAVRRPGNTVFSGQTGLRHAYILHSRLGGRTSG